VRTVFFQLKGMLSDREINLNKSKASWRAFKALIQRRT
jgi:hypothetical protein